MTPQQNVRAAFAVLALILISCRDIHAPDTSVLQRIEITPPNRAIARKEQYALQVLAYTASGLPTDVPELTWSSSEPSIASVSGNGTVTGVGLGYALITASGGGKSAYMFVNIRPASMVLTMQPQVISVGDTAIISGTTFDHAGGIITDDPTGFWWEYDYSDAVEFFRTPALSQRQLGVVGRKPGQLYLWADGGSVSAHLLITVISDAR